MGLDVRVCVCAWLEDGGLCAVPCANGCNGASERPSVRLSVLATLLTLGAGT